jgi:chromosome segregation ATPase
VSTVSPSYILANALEQKAQDIVMHSIYELEKRVKDILPELQRLREENIALKAAAKENERKLVNAQEELSLLERTRNEVSRLRSERDHWHTIYEKANAERRKIRESSTKAVKEAEEAKTLLSSKDGDIVELKKELDDLKKKVIVGITSQTESLSFTTLSPQTMLRRQKMKAVQRENKQLRTNQAHPNVHLSQDEFVTGKPSSCFYYYYYYFSFIFTNFVHLRRDK